MMTRAFLLVPLSRLSVAILIRGMDLPRMVVPMLVMVTLGCSLICSTSLLRSVRS